MASIRSSSSCNQYEFDRKIELLVLLPESVPLFTARNTVKPITRESDCGVVSLTFPFRAATLISKFLFGLTTFIDKFDSPILGPCDDDREHPPPIELKISRLDVRYHAFVAAHEILFLSSYYVDGLQTQKAVLVLGDICNSTMNDFFVETEYLNAKN